MEINMRVLFVGIGLATGGAEKLMSDLLPMLNNCDGVCCELLILSDKEEKYLRELRTNGVKVYVANRRNVFGEIVYVRNVIAKGNYDIVHANLFQPTYYCSLIKRFEMGRKNNCPKFVVTEHNTDNRRRHKKYLRLVEKWIYGAYDKIISISKGTEDSLKAWLQADDNRFVTVYNGINTVHFRDAIGYVRNDLFKTYTDKDVLLCMIGSFTKQKNHEFMIDVLEKLPERYKLILLGEGKLEKEVREYVHKKNIEERVMFMGFRKDVAEIIKTSDMVVIPSIWEGFGLIAVEAMACGKQVVCSKLRLEI